MRTSIGLRAAALLVGIFGGASCMTQGQRSSIVITAVTGLDYTPAAGTKPATCTCPTASGTVSELDFLRAGSSGLAPCLQVENRMPNNANLPIRVNTNDFQMEELHLTYENVGGTPAPLPTGEIVIATNGIVPAASKQTVPVVLVPASVGAALPAGSAVRVRAYLKGVLFDHSKIKSSEYEYIVIGCAAGSTCSTNCMNAP
jgi:hypothetical protein